MKIFEVTTEFDREGEIVTEVQYVTAEDDSIRTVVEYFARHCFEYEKELKGIREVVTVTQNIPMEKQK